VGKQRRDGEGFPSCGPDTEWDTYTDEYGVTYVCERITGIRRRWFGLGPRRWGWRSLGRLDP